jgi:RND family efflux transporter MFP subunit
MVRADDTILTSIITLDPMYTYFDIDEGTMLRLRRLVQAGKIRSARDVTLPVAFRLSDEHDFPHHSVIDFADNKVDPTKGTLEVRSVFDNPKKNLAPGLFVRVQVPVGAPHKAVLVNEQALSTDQGRRFLYVVNSKDQVESEKRFVDVGLADDGLRVIEKGLSLGERVIVSGLQREAQWARADNKVKPTLVDMLTFKPIMEVSAKGESAAGPPPTD